MNEQGSSTPHVGLIQLRSQDQGSTRVTKELFCSHCPYEIKAKRGLVSNDFGGYLHHQVSPWVMIKAWFNKVYDR